MVANILSGFARRSPGEFFAGRTLAQNPAWYGQGVAAALLAVAMGTLFVLDRKLERLEHETFRLQ